MSVDLRFDALDSKLSEPAAPAVPLCQSNCLFLDSIAAEASAWPLLSIEREEECDGCDCVDQPPPQLNLLESLLEKPPPTTALPPLEIVVFEIVVYGRAAPPIPIGKAGGGIE